MHVQHAAVMSARRLHLMLCTAAAGNALKNAWQPHSYLTLPSQVHKVDTVVSYRVGDA